MFTFGRNEGRGYKKHKGCYMICKRSLKEMPVIKNASNRCLGLSKRAAQRPPHKKWSFPSRISSANVTKSAGNWGFGHTYWGNPKWETSFFVQWRLSDASSAFLKTPQPAIWTFVEPRLWPTASVSNYYITTLWLIQLFISDTWVKCRTRRLVTTDASSIDTINFIWAWL